MMSGGLCVEGRSYRAKMGAKGPAAGKTKEAKMKAATAKKGIKKKKWSKGRARDKLNNAILFDKDTEARLLKEVPTYKLITTAVVSERLKITGSLARVAIRILAEKKLIKPVDHCSKMLIYTRATAAEE
eukprot:CAMPEP_0206305946 /NCGR_PEP_ID=MMETSP0106_2-20121207/10544_1 /ASSEMBLY_ACC=CAM_ASM_000206 /TAXON_ID=81532 /ORGANISM="Acanthoeca-like sp., Strain 10tr" /LENGTH=128 /DNA_ID=CAMNT_0053736847 /DNA_START=116 /DNA_END=502 /DNA_ORIENTATION=+